jgi:hypothetical protein
MRYFPNFGGVNVFRAPSILPRDLDLPEKFWKGWTRICNFGGFAENG